MIIVWDRKQHEVQDNEGRSWVNADGILVETTESLTGKAVGILVFKNGDVGIGNAGIFFVKHFRWVRATTAGHLCVIKSTSGDTIYESEADGPRFIDVQPFYKFTNGIVISSLDSGTLYIYLA